ncbi:MAG: zf-TFIIB domain-containing protein [Gemmatimonadetes bacterium]|nr:zf-TFIIB domain-containing protein [Gemmatimonadota bacterium]
MPERAPRTAPCPVCVGVKMEALRPWSEAPLVLDHCRRCGGMWFDVGEIGQARRLRPQAMWARVSLKDDAFRMKCHACQASFKRNRDRCPACGWENRLECPRCAKTMERLTRDALTLDVCRDCRGVWFDNVELAAVWNRNVTALASRGGAARPAPGEVRRDHFGLEYMLWPDPSFFVANAAAHTIAHGAAPAIGAVAEVAGQAVEATGELAGSVFGAIAEVIGNIFEGLGDLF